MTHSGALSMPCGLAQAIQSKPGKSATIFVTAILLYVLTASRLSTCVHWILASSVSSANTAFASSAAFGRPASVKIFSRYAWYFARTSGNGASSFR